MKFIKYKLKLSLLYYHKNYLIKFTVCKYLSCNADGDWLKISDASLSALDALCSPSAAITLKETK